MLVTIGGVAAIRLDDTFRGKSGKIVEQLKKFEVHSIRFYPLLPVFACVQKYLGFFRN